MSGHVPARMLAQLTDRDGRTCVMTGTDTPRLVPQHRQGGMGGRPDKHRLVNLLWLDSLLNGQIESDPTLQKIAKAWGIKVSIHCRHVEEIPVYFPALRTWYLLIGDSRVPIAPLDALDRMHGFYGDDYFEWAALANDWERNR